MLCRESLILLESHKKNWEVSDYIKESKSAFGALFVTRDTSQKKD